MDLNIQMLVVAIQTSKNTNPILSETWYEYQIFSHSIILPLLDVCLSTSITGMGFEMYSVSWKSKAIHRALFTSVRSMKCPLIRSFTFSDEYAIGKGYTNEWAAFFVRVNELRWSKALKNTWNWVDCVAHTHTVYDAMRWYEKRRPDNHFKWSELDINRCNTLICYVDF